MNRQDLDRKLRLLGIRPEAYSLDGGVPSEAYVLSFDGRRWSVYYSERGQASGIKWFDTEAEACEHMFGLVTGDKTTKAE